MLVIFREIGSIGIGNFEIFKWKICKIFMQPYAYGALHEFPLWLWDVLNLSASGICTKAFYSICVYIKSTKFCECERISLIFVKDVHVVKMLNILDRQNACNAAKLNLAHKICCVLVGINWNVHSHLYMLSVILGYICYS